MLKRNASLDLLRMMLMSGIVLIHTADHAVRDCQWLSYMMSFCVTGFVFITGYFGTAFKLSKIICLYGTAFACCILSAVTEPWCGSVTTYLHYCYRHLLGCWFLHAYAALLFMVPMLNSALERRGWECPVIMLVFGWSYLCSFGITQGFFPHVNGFGSHTLLMMVGVYVVARRFRLDQWELRIRTRHASIVALCLFLFGAFGFSRYNSPFAVLLSAFLVILFQRISLSASLTRVVLLLSPSMFAIYVLHNSDFNEMLTSQFGESLINMGFPAWVSCIIAGSVTYVIC